MAGGDRAIALAIMGFVMPSIPKTSSAAQQAQRAAELQAKVRDEGLTQSLEHTTTQHAAALLVAKAFIDAGSVKKAPVDITDVPANNQQHLSNALFELGAPTGRTSNDADSSVSVSVLAGVLEYDANQRAFRPDDRAFRPDYQSFSDRLIIDFSTLPQDPKRLDRMLIERGFEKLDGGAYRLADAGKLVQLIRPSNDGGWNITTNVPERTGSTENKIVSFDPSTGERSYRRMQVNDSRLPY